MPTARRDPGSSWAYRVPDTGIAELSDALTVAGVEPAGLSETDGQSTAWFDRRPDVSLPLEGSWELVDEADWAQRWKEGMEPVTVGRVTVTPPWLAAQGPMVDPTGPITLVIEPGLAFGTGHHETTTACLRALQSLPLDGRHVIDIGTGTGVLALAARALGASSVTAVDTDPEAVAVARHNLAVHALGDIALRHGSCDVAGPSGDVVIANIITDPLLALAPELVALVGPAGVLIASGIAVDRTDEAVAVFTAAGMDVRARQGRQWTSVLGRDRSGPRGHAPGP